MSFQDVQVLVTGATGFTGSVLTQKLVKLGAKVKAIHRRDNISEDLRNLPISWIKGNVFDPEIVEQACAGTEIIFHVAAAYRQAGISSEVYHNVHVKSTELLAKEALRQPGFKRFIHVSTVGVHGHIKNLPADENAPYAPGDIYQETKTKAELWIREFSAENNLPLTVIRPAAIYGPGDRRLLKLFKLAKLPIVPILGFGTGYYHLIHVDDLTDCFLLAAQKEVAVGEVFICGNKEPMTFKAMIKTICKALHKNPIFVRLPASPFFFLGWTCEAICKPFKIEPIIYPRRVAFFTKDRAFDTSKVRNLLDFEEQHTNEFGLATLCRWYKERGWI